MPKTPTLQDEELRIIVELLETERGELPGEIHHTDTSEYKEQLQKRLEIVEHLIEKLKAEIAASAGM